MRFVLALHTDDGKTFGVTVPDLPGCFSAGDSIDDAIENAIKAIDGHLSVMSDDGESIPVPHPIAEHQGNPDFASAIWAVAEVDVTKYEGKAEKINITLPRRLLAQIDEYAHTHGASRSGFLADAARAAMRRPAPVGNEKPPGSGLRDGRGL